MKKIEDTVILCDMDDTIEDLGGAWCIWLNNKYGLSVDSKKITDWNMRVVYPELTDEQIFEPLYIDDFWKTVKPYTDAQKYLYKLYSDGYTIYLCTSGDVLSTASKYKYMLKEHFPYIDLDHIISAKKKGMIKANVLIDDWVSSFSGGDFSKILINKPYNINIDATDAIRVNSWKEIYNHINHIYGGNDNEKSR